MLDRARKSSTGFTIHCLLVCLGGGLFSACGKASPPESEEAYLVSEVARTVGRWTGRRDRPEVTNLHPAWPAVAYEVKLGASRTKIVLHDAVWDPAAYVPLIPGVAAASAAPACADETWARALLSAGVPELVKIDEELSARLREGPGNPCLHEAAALLVGVFAAREYPGMFYDLRPYLSRMTGHLALARAYGASLKSLTGQFAETLLLTLSWRQADVPDRIAAFRGTDETSLSAHWAHALSLYSLQDFREAEQLQNPSRLELLAGGLAISMKANPKHLLSFIENHGDRASDWARIAYGRTGSVETCNAFDELGVEAMLAEAELVLGERRSSPRFIEAMNNERESQATRVLGMALWALFEQKALLPALGARYNCYDYWYGLPEKAAAIAKEIENEYRGLRFLPFLLNQIANDKASSARAVAGVVALARDRPELVTWPNWAYVPWDGALGSRPADLRKEGEWFRPLLPRGTAFEYNRRYYSTYGHRPDQTFLDQAHAQVRHALATRLWLEGKFGKSASAGVRRREYGPVAAFDRDALIDIAKAAHGVDPAEERRAYEQLCVLLPEDCANWALSLRQGGEEARAARVYEEWASVGDAVTVANSIRWTVEYFLAHGEKLRAERLARQAASTGAAKGLSILGTFLERMGHREAAFEQFRRINERYDNPSDLVAFLARQDDVPRFRNLLDDIVRAEFPRGLPRTDRAQLSAQPPRGPVTTRVPEAAELTGLEVGDVIGAVDGVRVVSLKQFLIARALRSDSRATTLLWRKNVLLEITVPRAAFPESRFEEHR